MRNVSRTGESSATNAVSVRATSATCGGPPTLDAFSVNRRGVVRWSTKPRVVVADPGREFAFVVDHRGEGVTKWSYRLEPAGNHTTVTESFEMVRDMPWYFKLGDRLMGIKDRRADLERGMRETMQRLKSAVEARAS